MDDSHANDTPQQEVANINNPSQIDDPPQIDGSSQVDSSSRVDGSSQVNITAQIDNTPPQASTKEDGQVEHIYKNHAFYAFRYLARIISGAVLVFTLVQMYSMTIASLIGLNSIASSSEATSYVLLVVTLIIATPIHLLSSATSGKDWKADDGRTRKYPTVLSMLYNISLGVTAVVSLGEFLIIAFGAVFGLNETTGVQILGKGLITLIEVAILSFAVIHEFGLIKKITKRLYIIAMGVAALVALILFLIIVAPKIRSAVYDSYTADDLRHIQSAIDGFCTKQNRQPNSLDELDFSSYPLKHDLNIYGYTITSMDLGKPYSNATLKYEICAEFKTDTRGKDDNVRSYTAYWSDYSQHGKGRECFSNEETIYNYDYSYTDSSAYFNNYTYSNNRT